MSGDFSLAPPPAANKANTRQAKKSSLKTSGSSSSSSFSTFSHSRTPSASNVDDFFEVPSSSSSISFSSGSQDKNDQPGSPEKASLDDFLNLSSVGNAHKRTPSSSSSLPAPSSSSSPAKPVGASNDFLDFFSGTTSSSANSSIASAKGKDDDLVTVGKRKEKEANQFGSDDESGSSTSSSSSSSSDSDSEEGEEKTGGRGKRGSTKKKGSMKASMKQEVTSPQSPPPQAQQQESQQSGENKELPPGVEIIDVLPLMKTGFSFMKFGRFGLPHFRLVQLSEDNSKLQWFSKGKDMKDTTIRLSEVDSVLEGQKTATFKRQPAAALVTTSFSICYRSTCTLDLIAKHINEYHIFVAGLKALLSLMDQKGHEHVSNLTELKLEVRQFVLKIEANAQVGSITVKRFNEKTQKAIEEAHNQFAHLKKKVSQENVYKHSRQWPAIEAALETINGELQLAGSLRSQGKEDAAQHTTWKARVNLEGLKHLMKAVKHNK